MTRAGDGSGTVTSNPAGIDCGATCSFDFATGTAVALTASADPGSTFTGWSGDCGVEPCSMTMDADHAVTATFQAAPGLAITLIDAPAQASRYDVFEASFELNQAFVNPFDPNEVTTEATFTGPGGSPITVPAFWYQDQTTSVSGGIETYVPQGEAHWRVRFAPAEVGQHSFVLSATTPTETATAGPFTFQTIASSNPGFVRVDPLDPIYLRADDGTPYVPMGHNAAFEDVEPFQGGTGFYEPLLASFGRAGENWTRIWMTDFNRSAIEWSTGDWHNNYPGLGRYALSSAWRLDEILRDAHANAVRVQLVLNDHGQVNSDVDGRWSRNPYNAANGGPVPSAAPHEFFTNSAARDLFMQRLRYIVARYSAFSDVFAWELFNEIQFIGSSAANPLNNSAIRQAVQDWHAEMSSYLHQIDPHQHLVTTSSDAGALTDPIWAMPTIDLTDMHTYDSPFTVRHDQVRDFLSGNQAEFNKPALVGEFGSSEECGFDPTTYGGTPEERDHLVQGTHLHNGVWAAALTGSGAMSWWWGCYIAADSARHRVAPEFPINEVTFPALAAFLDGEDFGADGMRPGAFSTTDEVKAAVLSNGESALGWVRDALNERGTGVGPGNLAPPRTISGANLQVEGFADGDYTVDFYDPYGAGGIVGSATATASGGILTIPLPDFDRDIALKVEQTAHQPDAVDDEATTNETKPVTIDVLANDLGGFAPITASTDPPNGAADCSSGFDCIYTPDPGFVGTDTFQYTLTNDDGSDTATVTVTVLGCPILAPAIDGGGIVTGQAWIACASASAHDPTAVRPDFMPLDGPELGLMTSGGAADVDDEMAFVDSILGQSLRGANDVSILRLDLDLPAGSTCLSFRVVFGSEEYPEFVGSFNDAFLAELDASTWSVSDNDIVAPGNIAFDQNGNVISVSSSFFDAGSVNSDNGTAYSATAGGDANGGTTPVLEVRTPITSGAHSLYLSVFDARDHRYDSGAFVDHLVALDVPSAECQAGANRPPVADDDTQTVVEDSVDNVVDVLAGDSDPDDDALTVTTIVSGPSHGGATIDTVNDVVLYTPDPNYNGPDSFSYRISDGRGGTDEGQVTLDVLPVNDRPTAADGTETTEHDVALPIDLGPRVADVETADANLTYTITDQPDHGTLTGSGPDFTYTPSAGYVGPDAFSYAVTDRGDPDACSPPGPQCSAALTSDAATISITITAAPNTPPSVDAGGPYPGDEGASINLNGTVSDPDPADTVTQTWSFVPSAGVDAGATCTFGDSGAVDTTVTCTDDGTYTLTLTVDDGVNPPVLDTATLTLANVDPTVAISAPTAGATFEVGASVDVDADLDDAGANDSHTCSLDWGDGSPPEDGTIAAGACSADHSYAAAGDYTITVTVDDDDGGTGSDSVGITITAAPNQPPVPNAGPNRTAAEGATITLNGTVMDLENDEVIVTWSAAPLSGVDAGATCVFGGTNPVDPTVRCTDDGRWTLTLSATDSFHATPAIDTMILNVSNVAPTVAATVEPPPPPGAGYQPGEGVTVTSTITDPGTNDSHSCAVRWGDGASWTGPATGGGCNPPPHAYANNGTFNVRTYTITVRATDDDGGSGTDTVTVLIDPCTQRGTPANDNMVGTVGNDVLCGLGGNDVLNGLGGNDVFVGGPGNDTASYVGSPGAVSANLTTRTATGWGSDQFDAIENLRGSAHADLLIGDTDDNQLWGENGADEERGLDGTDTIEGGDGNDILAGGNRADTIRGENGNDILNGGPGNDAIGGGPGNDEIAGVDGADSVFGGDGGDTITGGLGNDTLRGEDGLDDINGGPDRDTITGGPDGDTLVGGDDRDVILGGDNNDIVLGNDDNDDLSGDDGSDLVNGGNGNDVMHGGLGEDILIGGSGNDHIAGDIGDNPSQSQGDEDHINGGTGDDLLYGQGGNDCSNQLQQHSQCPTAGTIDRDPSFRAQLQGGGDEDRIHGGPGSDRLDGGPEDDNRLVGGTGGNDFCSFGPAPRGDHRDRSCELPSIGNRDVPWGSWNFN